MPVKTCIAMLIIFLSNLTITIPDLSLAQDHQDVAQEAGSYLAIMSAYSPELTRLLDEAVVHTIRTINERDFHLASLGSQEVILVLSGIGLTNATITTRLLLDSFDISAIVFSGIAGGINPNLNIGDVTVPARWCLVDEDMDVDDETIWIAVDSSMMEIAREASRHVVLNDCIEDSVCFEHVPKIVFGGNGVSNSFFVDDAIYREWLWDTFEANAVDMETAAMAHIAKDRAVPFIAFRSLSDLAGGGPGENEIGIFFQLAADNAATMVIAFLEQRAESDVITGHAVDQLSQDVLLSQNYPNPFNSTTVITYSVLQENFVTLTIFDLLGREITTLVNQLQKSGTYSVIYDGSQIPSGIYFFKLRVGNAVSAVRKMILMR